MGIEGCWGQASVIRYLLIRIDAVSSISCGLARPRSLVGEKPTQVAVSHGPGIQPCRCSGNRAYQRDLMRRQERKRGAMVIPPQAGLTVKALSPDKTVMGEADAVYEGLKRAWGQS